MTTGASRVHGGIWTKPATNRGVRHAAAACAGTSPPGQQARSPAERALSVRVLGFGCGADYLEGPVSSTPPEFAVPQVRLVLRGACRRGRVGLGHIGYMRAARVRVV